MKTANLSSDPSLKTVLTPVKNSTFYRNMSTNVDRNEVQKVYLYNSGWINQHLSNERRSHHYLNRSFRPVYDWTDQAYFSHYEVLWVRFVERIRPGSTPQGLTLTAAQKVLQQRWYR